MSDGSEIIAWLGGGTGLLTGALWLIKSLGGRVVEHEDASKKKLQTELEQAQKAERTTAETLIELKIDMRNLKGSVDTVSGQLSRMEAENDRAISDLRAEFKEHLAEVETRMKQDLQRAVSAPRRSRDR